MNRWVWSVTQENWDVVRNYSIWAVSDEHKTKRIKNNDYMLFYVKGTGLFRGIFQVTSGWYKSKKMIWPDEIKAKKKIYSYECKLKPFLIKDVIFKNIQHQLEFSSSYMTNPGIVLKATRNGPANFTKPISEQDFNIIESHKESEIEPQETIGDPSHDETIGDPGHVEIVEYLDKMGDALGFETYTDMEHARVITGVLDMVWEMKMGGMGVIKYSFEVQVSGAIKSLVTNLVASLNDPAVKKVVAVSDTKQLEQIRNYVENIDAYTPTTKSMFVFLDMQLVKEFIKLQPKLIELKKTLSI